MRADNDHKANNKFSLSTFADSSWFELTYGYPNVKSRACHIAVSKYISISTPVQHALNCHYVLHYVTIHLQLIVSQFPDNTSQLPLITANYHCLLPMPIQRQLAGQLAAIKPCIGSGVCSKYTFGLQHELTRSRDSCDYQW